MNLPKRGDRIRLTYMDIAPPGQVPEPCPIEVGAEGTVTFSNEMSLGVKWDDGRTLGLVPGHDQWEVIA